MKTYGEAMQEAVEAFGEALQKFAEEWDRFVINLRDDAPVYIEFCTKCNQHTRTRAEVIDKLDCVGFALRCTVCGGWVKWRTAECSRTEPDEFCPECCKPTRTGTTSTDIRVCVECCLPRGHRRAYCAKCRRVVAVNVQTLSGSGRAMFCKTCDAYLGEHSIPSGPIPEKVSYCPRCNEPTHTIAIGEDEPDGIPGQATVNRCARCGRLR